MATRRESAALGKAKSLAGEEQRFAKREALAKPGTERQSTKP